MTFNDPSLQEALEEAAPHIENYTANLDAIDEDVAKLESYLTARGCRVEAFVCFRKAERAGEEDDAGQMDFEYVYWGKSNKEPGRWRLMFQLDRKRSTCSMDGYPIWEETEISEYRPLIECPARVRLAVHRSKALPRLLKEVAKQYALDPQVLEEPVEDRSIARR